MEEYARGEQHSDDDASHRAVDAICEITKATFDRSDVLHWEASKLTKSFELRLESQRNALAEIKSLYSSIDLSNIPAEANVLLEILALCKDTEAAMITTAELRTSNAGGQSSGLQNQQQLADLSPPPSPPTERAIV
ncbi:unnamed protein product [Heterosigma akashiwo]